MNNLRDWVVSVLGEPKFHEVFENPNWIGTGSQRYSTITVQYDWAFIAGALAYIICLIGFITIIRMLLGRWRRR